MQRRPGCFVGFAGSIVVVDRSADQMQNREAIHDTISRTSLLDPPKNGLAVAFELHPDLARDGIEVGRFPLCRVLMINDQSYPWFVLVPQREDIRDTVDLSDIDYQALWSESREFSRGIMNAFAGEKLNVAALGNITPQLHIHHIVRFTKDAAWPEPIWGKQPLVPYSKDQVLEFGNRLRAEVIQGFKHTEINPS